ncbi:PREDICTED: mitochondrial import inner membrane translocase subunit TIM16 isoform X2 [Crocodylus porosus]|uniref:mitochondrial import inner membrane translocase subunit TIM16 isoform X2 n=1 Tax=Crocodylus porosus TaxID=8502 RepID=UPI0009399CD3|nr:PREDICTED: mitochondrial import inner membrane translocase subunit TIM16 isoform X2 [Crocodylus porosus]
MAALRRGRLDGASPALPFALCPGDLEGGGSVGNMARYLAQIVVLGAQVLGRAFALALRQEFAASRAAAEARGRGRPLSAAESRVAGISLQEAQQILNVSSLAPEEIQKVVRAKERLDEELRIQAQSQKREEQKPET